MDGLKVTGRSDKSKASGRAASSAAKVAAILSKPDKPELKKIAPQVAEWLRKHRYTVLVDRETATYIAGDRVVDRANIAAEKPRFVVVLGGDGTMLAAARAV